MLQRLLPVCTVLTSVALGPAAFADPGPAAFGAAPLVVGVATEVTTAAVGVSLLGSDRTGGSLARAGWLTVSAGFALAPLAAHAVAGEWARGLLFASLPTACAVATALLLPGDERSLDSLRRRDQLLLWPLMTLGLIGSVVGLVDAGSADSRATPPVRQAVSFAPVLTTTSALAAVAGAF